jgi:hypothetical protein
MPFLIDFEIKFWSLLFFKRFSKEASVTPFLLATFSIILEKSRLL